jgi:hypothetical protein
MTIYRRLLPMLLLLAIVGPAWSQSAEYRVRDLLEPCVEGDNDSRGGAALEMECEQYINGFTHLYLRSGLAEKDKVCLPEQNQADEIRWEFMRWAHKNFGDRDRPAIEGLIATLKDRFACK